MEWRRNRAKEDFELNKQVRLFRVQVTVTSNTRSSLVPWYVSETSYFQLVSNDETLFRLNTRKIIPLQGMYDDLESSHDTDPGHSVFTYAEYKKLDSHYGTKKVLRPLAG